MSATIYLSPSGNPVEVATPGDIPAQGREADVVTQVAGGAVDITNTEVVLQNNAPADIMLTLAEPNPNFFYSGSIEVDLHYYGGSNGVNPPVSTSADVVLTIEKSIDGGAFAAVANGEVEVWALASDFADTATRRMRAAFAPTLGSLLGVTGGPGSSIRLRFKAGATVANSAQGANCSVRSGGSGTLVAYLKEQTTLP